MVVEKRCGVATYYWTRKNRWTLLGALLTMSVGLSIRGLSPSATMTIVPGWYPVFTLPLGIALHTSVVDRKKQSIVVSPTYLKSTPAAPFCVMLT